MRVGWGAGRGPCLARRGWNVGTAGGGGRGGYPVTTGAGGGAGLPLESDGAAQSCTLFTFAPRFPTPPTFGTTERDKFCAKPQCF